MTKFNISDVIANLVFQTNPELTSRLEAQEEALRESPCSDPVIGRWADDADHVLSTLSLSDKDFGEMHPSVAHVSGVERRRLAAAIETHMGKCQHCSLKRGYDVELTARIERAFRQDDDFISQLLKEDEADDTQEGEHAGAERERRRAAGR